MAPKGGGEVLKSDEDDLKGDAETPYGDGKALKSEGWQIRLKELRRCIKWRQKDLQAQQKRP